MKVRVGDKVLILAGKDKGKDGIVTVTLKKKDRVVVEGINIVKKHQKPGRAGETGGILETESSIHVSNVKIIEPVKREEKKKTKKVEAKADTKPAAKKAAPKKKKSEEA